MLDAYGEYFDQCELANRAPLPYAEWLAQQEHKTLAAVTKGEYKKP